MKAQQRWAIQFKSSSRRNGIITIGFCLGRTSSHRQIRHFSSMHFFRQVWHLIDLNNLSFVVLLKTYVSCNNLLAILASRSLNRLPSKCSGRTDRFSTGTAWSILGRSSWDRRWRETQTRCSSAWLDGDLASSWQKRRGRAGWECGRWEHLKDKIKKD